MPLHLAMGSGRRSGVGQALPATSEANKTKLEAGRDLHQYQRERSLPVPSCGFGRANDRLPTNGSSGCSSSQAIPSHTLALGLSACQQGIRVRFTTAAALVHELMEARDEKRLLRYQRQLLRQELLIVDELGFCSVIQDRR